MRSRSLVTTFLDLTGVGLLVVAAVVLWWPAALIVGGVACLTASRSLTVPGRRVS